MIQGLDVKPERKRQKRKRPIILKIVCILLFLRVAFIAILVTFLSLGITFFEKEEPLSQVLGAGITLAVAGLGVFLLIAAIGLWQLQPWAWRLNVMIMGFLLVSDLWTHFANASNLENDLSLLLNILIVFYLVYPEVRGLFSATREIASHT